MKTRFNLLYPVSIVIFFVLASAGYKMLSRPIQNNTPAVQKAFGATVVFRDAIRVSDNEVKLRFYIKGFQKHNNRKSIAFGTARVPTGIYNSGPGYTVFTTSKSTKSGQIDCAVNLKMPRKIRQITLRQEVILQRPDKELKFELKNIKPSDLPVIKQVGKYKFIINKLYINKYLESGHMESKLVSGVYKDDFVLGSTGMLSIGVEVISNCPYYVLNTPEAIVRINGKEYYQIARSLPLGENRYSYKGMTKCVYMYIRMDPPPKKLDFNFWYLLDANPEDRTWIEFKNIKIPNI